MDRKMYEAAASGDITFLQQVTDDKLDLYQVTPQKNTILHNAVNFKQLEFSKQVLGLCPSLLLKANAKGESPLHVAAKIGCFKIAERLVNNAKTLHKDVESQLVDAQKELLRMVNQEKDTALHVAVRERHSATAKLLMKADPILLDFVNSENASPLYLAVDGFVSSVVHCILEFSPAFHFGGPKGMTALHSAVVHRNHDFVKVLLEKRPDMIKEVDMLGWTPLHYSAHNGLLEITRLFLQCDSSTAYLLDRDGTSALHVAAFNGHIHIVEELIQYCPDIAELIDKKGRTALHVAVLGQQEKMVNYILKMPKLATMINEHDEEGNTALHLAVIHRIVNIIKCLTLDKKVRRRAMNKAFSTARDIFTSQRNDLEPSYSSSKTRYFLRGTAGLQCQFIDKYEKKRMMGESIEQEKSDLCAVKENPDETTRSMLEIHLLVAMLIVTVTFAGAFTVPGGYDNKGMANFIGKAIFKAFLIFDTIAFVFSITAVFIHVGTSELGYRNQTRYSGLAMTSILIALYAMVLAFASGIYLLLAKSVGLAIALYIMAVSLLLGFSVMWFLDPAGLVPVPSKARYLRNLLFRYGIV